ncbi:MAG: GYF domain-containing protein [Thermoguttaceae bacterium]
MAANSPGWYIPGEGKQPAGPLTTEQVLNLWRAKRIAPDTLCWREGMSAWLPLSQTEPFAVTMAAAAISSSAPPMAPPQGSNLLQQMAVWLAILVFLGTVATIGYVYWQERNEAQKAKKRIAAEDYEEAKELCESLQDSFFFRNEGDYLSAMADVRQYATVADSENADKTALKKSKRQLQELFRARESWRQQAKNDFADLLGIVSKKSLDRYDRYETLTDLLEELKLIDPPELAQRLLNILKTDLKRNDATGQIRGTFVVRMAKLRPELVNEAVTAVLASEEQSGTQRSSIAMIVRWANEAPTLARPLADALSEAASNRARSSRFQTADAIIAAAASMCPEVQESCHRRRIDWLKLQLARDDYANVLRSLDDMPRGDSKFAAELGSLCLEAARQTAKSNRFVAQKFVEQAFDRQSDLAESENALLLWIQLHPTPGDEKLRRCRQFSNLFADSEQCDFVRLTILRDAAADPGERRFASLYSEAAYAEAMSLLARKNPSSELDPLVWNLTQRLADAEQYAKAVRLGEAFAKTFPDSSVAQEIAGKLAAWKAIPATSSGRSKNLRSSRMDLNEKLLRRKTTINTSTAVYNAVANKNVWIIEVADTCTADQFDAEQTRLLRKWVGDGGVLWANSNVLQLFGVRYFKLDHWMMSNEKLVPAGGSHSILEDVKLVYSGHVDGKSHTLSYRGVIPLLALKDRYGDDLPAGSAVWSLVPYGAGWISDPKPVDLNHGDGALFWARFCQFCLHELPWDRPDMPPDSGSRDAEDSNTSAPADNTLTGTWETSTGDRFLISDDGQSATISLLYGRHLNSFSGKLTRPEGKPEAKTLSGVLNVGYDFESSRRFAIPVSVTIKEHDPDHLYFRADWPWWNGAGRYVGRKPSTEVLTRTATDSPKSSRHNGNWFTPPASVHRKK